MHFSVLNNMTPWSRVLEKLIVTQWSKMYSSFMASEIHIITRTCECEGL